MSYSVPKSLPPSTLKFLDWLKKTDGRDKLYRLVAYGSKIPVNLLQHSNPELSGKLKKGASSVGLGRKMMRLFKVFSFLQDFLLAFHSTGDIYEKYLSCLKAASLSVWMAVDHIQWMAKVGYFKIVNEKQMAFYHSKAWFFGLFFGVVLNGYKLNKAYKNGKVDSKKEFKLKQGIVKNFLDLWIPVARLDWLPISDLQVGVCGTLTSFIGIYDTWP
jgi:hypothetical protein